MIAQLARSMHASANFCADKNASYNHRVDNPDEYNWCPVKEKGWDVILFAGIAVVVACISQGPYSSLIVLLSGGALMGFAYPFNLKEVGNGLSLWLGIEPYELFFYVFLPPLLLDAALKIDWYVFKKVFLNIMTLAFFVVLLSTALLVPVMLYVFGLRSQGWQWYDAALFGSMIASTDAVAIVAVLKKSGPPERWRILLEGESLLNDASSITLFTIFIQFAIDAAQGHPLSDTAGQIIMNVLQKTAWLTAGGFCIGIAFGVCTRTILRFLQRYGATAEQQIALTLALGYLAFYTANAPCKVSGVIAVAVFGLYGAATSQFDISAKLEESGAFEDFWNSFAFVANGIVFFYAGASSVNFLIRSVASLTADGRTQYLISAVWRAPLIWVGLNALRFTVISAFRPLFKLWGAPMEGRDVLLCSAAGLRGSVSLIMAQAVVIEVPRSDNPIMQRVQSEVVMYTAVFVLLTLLIQAPMLPHILSWTKLDTIPLEHQIMRRKAVGLLLGGTHAAIESLQGDEEELMRGVDWKLVAATVNMAPKLQRFINPRDQTVFRRHRASILAWLATLSCCGARGDTADEEMGTGSGEAVQSPFGLQQPPEGFRDEEDEPQMVPSEVGDAQQPLLSTASAPVALAAPELDLDGDDDSVDAPPSADGADEVTPLIDAAAYLGMSHGHGHTVPAPLQPRAASASDTEEEDEPTLDPNEAADMRSRICAGMKRFFHTKSMEGLLSRAGLRMLDHSCDDQIDSPMAPLRIWAKLERHIKSNWQMGVLLWVVLRLRKAGIALTASRLVLVQYLLGPPLYWTINAGMQLASKQVLLCSEVAMEYLLALTHSPGVRWLQEHRPSSTLVEEIRAESHLVWKFILSLELESSDRFKAIQSYRATMAVLRQQLAFVERLKHSGMLSDTEADLVAEPIDETTRGLIHSGPGWQAPYVTDVLQSLPLFQDMPREYIHELLLQGNLVSHSPKSHIHDASPDEGIVIVCHGTMRVVVTPWTGQVQTHYVGTGGMFGLVPALTGISYQGRTYAIGGGDAMGQGPTIFQLPREGVEHVHQQAAAGHHEFIQLETDMFRLAAMDVTESLRDVFLHVVCGALLAYHAKTDTSRAEADAAGAAAAALKRVPSSRAPSTIGSLSIPRNRRKPVGAPKSRQSPWSLEPAFEYSPTTSFSRQGSAAVVVHEQRAARRKAAARRAKVQAQELYEELHDQLAHARFVELPAGGAVPHVCNTVILKGSVRLRSPNPAVVSAEATDVLKSHPEGRPKVHSAPALLPWVYDVTPGDDAPSGHVDVSEKGRLEGGPDGAVVVFADNEDVALCKLIAKVEGKSNRQERSPLRPLNIDATDHNLRPPRSIIALQDFKGD